MRIEHASLRHFRNYDDVQIEAVPHKNLFIGQNGAGKTNILEAIYFLSHGKSHRTRSDRELIQWNQPFATVRLQAHSHRHGGQLTLEAQLTLSPQNTLKTLFKLNGNPVKSRSDIVGKIPTVTFFLPDLLMLRGAPEDRRNALDSALVQLDPVHFKRLAAYNRVRQQKSQLLKQWPHAGDPHLLESLNQQLAVTGAELMLSRMEYSLRLESLAELAYHELSLGQESLSICYQPSFSVTLEQLTREGLQQDLQEAIRQRQQEELRRGQVLIGPHRDDLRFYLDERDAAAFGSQGQQRTIVLAFKLAEIQLLEQHLQEETPILLLDDVMAELDPTRQHQLLHHLDPGMQVFLTTTHVDAGLQGFLNTATTARLFTVTPGCVTRQDNSKWRDEVCHE